MEFVATVSDVDDRSIDTDDELAEQVEPPEVDADQRPIIISLSVDAYPSRNTGLLNSTVVVDQKRSDANQRKLHRRRTEYHRRDQVEQRNHEL